MAAWLPGCATAVNTLQVCRVSGATGRPTSRTCGTKLWSQLALCNGPRAAFDKYQLHLLRSPIQIGAFFIAGLSVGDCTRSGMPSAMVLLCCPRRPFVHDGGST
mmetsp:Transcript_44635/g.80027  ORF Transcript_44635/g.80027 Transcript_44635/m.80027 type:complete len:104 (+) Transcript_44635:435-746(+)